MKINVPSFMVEAIELFHKVYDAEDGAGIMHIIVADGNLDDDSLFYCTTVWYSRENGELTKEELECGFDRASPELRLLQKQLLDQLETMSETQRHMAYWIFDNPYFIEDHGVRVNTVIEG